VLQFKSRLSKMMWHAHFVSIVTSTFVWAHWFHPIGQTWTKNISHSICLMNDWRLKTYWFIIISTTKIVQRKLFGCQCFGRHNVSNSNNFYHHNFDKIVSIPKGSMTNTHWVCKDLNNLWSSNLLGSTYIFYLVT